MPFLYRTNHQIGVSEAYIRAYESGRRNPKPKSLEAIAKALAVNVEVLANDNIDGIRAMHQLFQIFRQYSGELTEMKGDNGNNTISISFGSLALMSSWMNRYNEYLAEVEKCNEIKDVKQRGEALINAENRFNWWMDTYPEGEHDLNLLKIQAAHDEFMNMLEKNPKEEE